MKTASRCFVTAGSVVLATLGLFTNGIFAQSLYRGTTPPNWDVRLTSARQQIASKTNAQTSSFAQTQAQVTAKATTALRKKVAGLQVNISAVTGSAEIVRSSHALTGPAPSQPGEAIVRSFLTENNDLYGLSSSDLAQLHFIGESVSQGSGLRMVRVEQTVNGRPVFQSESRFILDRDGRLIRSVGLMARNATASAVGLTGLIAPEQALVSAMSSVGLQVSASSMTRSSWAANGYKVSMVTNDPQIAGEVTSQVVYFVAAPGDLIPALSQVTFTNRGADWYTLVDARTGRLLWRKNIRDSLSTQDARFRVYVQADGVTPADNPAPLSPTTAVPGSGTQPSEIAPTIVSMLLAQSLTASPNGWIDDCSIGGCTASQTQTIGNNVHAYMDRTGGVDANIPDTDAASVLDGNGKPTGNPDAFGRNRDFLGTTPRDFQTNFLPPPQGGNPEAGQSCTGSGNNGTLPVDQFRRGALTQMFYVSNWYHDQLYTLGFDEAAGNFQQTNFSGMGLGSDRVLAECEDSSGTNNSNFSTPPDGTSGRMQMYRFTGPTIDRDASLDAEVMMHELTHGLSNRLVGNATGLNWSPAEGMGEGWSDFYALSLLNNTNSDNPDGKYAFGAYATYKFAGLAYTDNYVYGIRRFPYCTDNSVNPLTWADVDDVTNDLSGGITPDPLGTNIGGAFEVHNIGEVWALSLWEVRSRIIADPAGANGDVPTGNHTSLQLITDALKLTPLNPSFTDARDAIIDADCATNGCGNEQSIWSGFADRGLGYKATDSGAISGRYLTSHMGIRESFSVPYLDIVNPTTDVTIDDSASNNNGAIDPGEAIKLTVKLTNPWRSSSKAVTSATATLATTNADVTIYDNTSTYGAIAPQGSATGDSFTITVAPTATAGESLNFVVTANSNIGSTSTSFSLRVGTRNGTDAPVTYSHSALGLSIVNKAPRGTRDSINVTDDFEISDLNFTINSVTHPGVGDLTALLRAPNGYGTDYVSLIDGLTDVGGTAITDMVIDDDVANNAANDMVQATSANAPYTKSWLPVYNSPWAAIVNPSLPADSVGELSRLDGTSTKGTWSFLMADVFTATEGGTDGNGTLNSWSFTVTPTHFDVTPFTTAGANVSGTQTVSGSFTAGGTVTYTVTLTNNGTAGQADNPGHEFNETLPSTLTLTGVMSSSGTAAMSGNTANWDGSLAPLGGSVTITITATINNGAEGSTVSAQGTINYDADVNGTNESTAVTDDPNTAAPNDPTTFTVAAGPATHFVVSAPATATAGTPFNFTVTAYDAGNNVAMSYSGTVHFTSSDSAAVLPANSMLTNGMGTFSATLNTAGNQTITATDTVDSSITGTSNSILVAAAPTPTPTATPTATPAATPAKALNISTRLCVDVGDKVMIGGFIVTGSASKPVVIRGLGPSLTHHGIPASAVLMDPILELHGPNGALISRNNNWKDSPQRSQIENTPLQPTDEHESVIVATLAPGKYTAILRGVNKGTGVGEVEVYDHDPSTNSVLANISTRGFVQTGNDVMIGGFMLGSTTGSSRIVIRGLGPSLRSAGLTNVLVDPTLGVHDANGNLMLTNDNWMDDPTSAARVTLNGLAPTNPNESAIYVVLPPGAYTAILAGKNGGIGIGLVEVYNLQ